MKKNQASEDFAEVFGNFFGSDKAPRKRTQAPPKQVCTNCGGLGTVQTGILFMPETNCTRCNGAGIS